MLQKGAAGRQQVYVCRVGGAAVVATCFAQQTVMVSC